MHGRSLGAWQGQQLQGAPLRGIRDPFVRRIADRRRLTVVAADGSQKKKDKKGNWLDTAVANKKKERFAEDADFTIDDINPVAIGRRSRQVLHPPPPVLPHHQLPHCITIQPAHPFRAYLIALRHMLNVGGHSPGASPLYLSCRICLTSCECLQHRCRTHSNRIHSAALTELTEIDVQPHIHYKKFTTFTFYNDTCKIRMPGKEIIEYVPDTWTPAPGL